MTSTTEGSADRLPLLLKIGWGIGSLGTNTVLYVSSLLLLYFFTVVLGIAPAIAGSILAAVKLLDCIAAPLTGLASDRTRTRWGRRRPYLLAGAFVTALGIVLALNPPSASPAFLVFALLIVAIGYSLFNVPYLAMPPEMATTPAERTSLVSWRIVFVSVGGVATTAALPALIKFMGGGRVGYGAAGIAAGAIVFVAMFVCFLATRGANLGEDAGGPASSGSIGSWLSVFRNRPFVLLVLAKILQLFGLSAVSASILFLFKMVLGADEGVLAVFGLVASVSSIASIPVWARLAPRFGKRNLYIVSVVGYAFVGTTWLLADAGTPMALLLARAFVSGICTGGLLLMGQSILPDTIAYDRETTGLRREGIYAGVYTVVEKGSSALGPLVVGGILQIVGFSAIAKGAAITPEVIRGIYISAAMIPAGAYVLSIVPLLFYNLDERKAAVPMPEAGEADAIL